MKKAHQFENTNISSFILKLSKLLEDPRTENIITWSPEGDSITIDSHNEQLESILAKYFNHTKISSFVRQLNLYGFKKISQRGSQMMYKHPQFIKDKINMHKLIKRKRKNKTKTQKIETTESKEQNPILEKEKMKIKGLEDIYFRMKRYNEKITNQTQLIKNNATTLAQSKDSMFLTSLKTSCPENPGKLNQYLKQLYKQKSNDQQSTPSTQTAQVRQLQQHQNHNFYYMNEQEQENGQGEFINNVMDILKQNNEEQSKKQMSRKDERYANFWQDEEIEMDFAQQK